MPPRSIAVLSGVLLAATLAATACSNREASVNRRGHSGSTTASVVNGLQEVDVDATATYRFNPSTITVHPGLVRIDLHNIGKSGVGAPHNWALPVANVTTPLAAAGQVKTVTFTAPAPGRYTFVCTIHRKQGQTGTLVVLDR
jgi:plastocyanin